jgi:serine/threonine-protein kinase HipA
MRSWRQDFAADGVDEATIRRLARAFSTDLDRPPASEATSSPRS